jgi:enterochelin esterase-like enzyme
MQRFIAFVLVAWLCCSSGVIAQQGPPRPPEFVSPEINPADGSIAFRLFAPQADTVRLASSDLPGANPFGPGLELIKDDRGVWEATTGPVPPGTYRYLFNIDGVQAVDPRNTVTSEANSMVWSLVTVPGSDVSDLRDVPHGAVAEVTYHSKSLDRFRRAHVYTPPGYDRGTEPLPVLYLLHGATDGDDSWSTVGRAGLVLDNLIADGKAVPMIVVMPHGHTGAFSFGPGGNLQQQMEEFTRDFTNDLRPLIEAHYRVSMERKHRAVAGLSMGGAQTLDIAIANLGDYAYVGVFSSGVFGINGTGFGGGGGPTWQERHQAALDDASLKEGLELVWFATGSEDFLLDTTRETVKVLREKGFDVTYEETDGGHTWTNWREHYLPAFAPLLFR